LAYGSGPLIPHGPYLLPLSPSILIEASCQRYPLSSLLTSLPTDVFFPTDVLFYDPCSNRTACSPFNPAIRRFEYRIPLAAPINSLPNKEMPACEEFRTRLPLALLTHPFLLMYTPCLLLPYVPFLFDSPLQRWSVPVDWRTPFPLFPSPPPPRRTLSPPDLTSPLLSVP